MKWKFKELQDFYEERGRKQKKDRKNEKPKKNQNKKTEPGNSIEYQISGGLMFLALNFLI